MNKSLLLAATAAFVLATPASAQILGGGGPLGGPLGGGLGGSVGGTLGTTIDRTRTTVDTSTRVRVDRELPARRMRRGDVLDTVPRLGERPIATRGSARADSRLSLDQRMLRTRGVAAANRRGMRRVSATRTGVQVFVPPVIVPAPPAPVVYRSYYPAYSSGYYYEPGAVFIESRYAEPYIERQYDDLEVALEDTGVTVERRGGDLVVMLPADVTFAFDKSEIRPRFFNVLNAFIQSLLTYPGTDVEVVGHTDSAGSEAYNMSLSERRGRSVADYLVARGIDPSRLVVEAMGESDPIATNATAEGRAANRRVELIIHPRAG